ncbi:uncharacterized protein EV154DRAFT_503742 [Mucor mucedo]|uniref:uncharacterized protein n=1 Tax=Mucor mucedo TaxID=29922 RepID=UPI00221F794B|nr:uncharacterized protein EV154DRAFT_503742 [Mucor mucedo]KAI7892846.1 hypothetical protein EV154DRAFT_503742 [Mucor mucedo]
MTQRKEEKPSVATHCWWNEDILSNPDAPSFRDFVLISEFSELEGPLPLAVVTDTAYIDLKFYTETPSPSSPHLKDLKTLGLDTFDFNAFVLRVVSVDRSSEYEQMDEPLTPSSLFADSATPCAFSIPDDTQVYFTDSEHKFFAFTHHLTLFDINARGYVHPVALSYITRDPDKIVIRFRELMERFNLVSLKMKKGNYSNFTLDLQYRLLDLEYTERIQTSGLSLHAIKGATTATKLMIDTLESSLSQMNNHHHGKTIMMKPVVEHTTTVKGYQPKCIETLYPVPHFERKLRSLAQLCQEPADDEKMNHVVPLVFSILESSSIISEKPAVATMNHDMYAEAIVSIQEMTAYLGKSSVVLDVNEEEDLFVRPVSSALTFGRTFMLNMENPQPREEEKEETSVVLKDESDVLLDHAEKLKRPDSSKHYSSQETDDEEIYYPVLQAPSQLWPTPRYPPRHLLEILRQYQSLIVDVLFSLLTGRTVLIRGCDANKSHVQQVVHALSVFVPGQNRERHQIIPWFDQSRLTDSQIASIKLVGIDKENMDASIHIEGSCVLDVDVKHGSLHSSPVYVEGQWINQLLDRLMLFTSDESYLAYLHTVFMTMSLKAFVYHHLYLCDEFKLTEESIPSDTQSVHKGYTSETSESSTLSRRWSVRLLNYLKKHEDPPDDDSISRRSSVSTTVSTVPIATTPATAAAAAAPPPAEQETTDNDEDYSEENQATVTLQNLFNKKQEQPRTVLGLFPSSPSETLLVNQGYCSGGSSSDSSSPHASIMDEFDLGPNESLLNFRETVIAEEEELDYFGQTRLPDTDYDEEVSSSSEEEEEEEEKSKRRPSRRYRRRQVRSRKPSDVGPDGVSYTERRGRRYLQEKMKVYGDDQTIVVYLATCVL